MPVRMTEIPPQTPIGVTKIDVEVGNLIAETDFNTELDLITALPVERSVESRDFTQVGQILRKMLPLKVQMVEAATESSIIDVTPTSMDAVLPVKKPVTTDFMLGAAPQIRASETAVHTKAVPGERTDSEPQKVEIIPLGPPVIDKIPSQTLKSNGPERSSVPDIPFTSKRLNNSQISEHHGGKTPGNDHGDKHALSQSQVNTPRSRVPAPLNVVKDEIPKSNPHTSTEVQRDIGELVASISDKPQLQRSLPTAVPMVQSPAGRPQTAEVKIVSQISNAISNTSKDTVEIRLDPPELGRVTISITQTDSGLSATVVSEKSEIADLLRRHAELLSRELSKSGFNDASLEFSHRDQRQDRPTFEGDQTHSSVSPDQAETTSSIEMTLRSQSGSLDIRL